jgi:hypothetical protein
MMTSLRSKWAAGKAVRAGPAVRGRIPHHFYTALFGSFPVRIKMARDVTDEQRGRQPIFNATPWAAAGWLFFRFARSTRINSDLGASLSPVRLGLL